MNFFIVFELDSWPRDLNTNFVLAGCLFGGVKSNKNADPDKYSCSANGIAFNNMVKVKMLLVLELIWAHLCVMIIKENIS